MPPKTTEAEFDALVAQAGLPLTVAQKAAIHAVFGGIEAMQALVRSPAPSPEAAPAGVCLAEPATTFSAGSGSVESGR
jgi:hypothetical protein